MRDRRPSMDAAGQRRAPVLIVDDDRHFLASLGRSLRRLDPGLDFHLVATPSEVMGKLSAGGEFVIVSDWMMPDMSGLELCAEARRFADRFPGLEIYFLLFSGKGRTDEALEALAFNVDDYVAKPIEIRELLSRIRVGQRYLASRRQILEAVVAAEEAGRSKARFLSTMSHEIRTPLQAISTMSDLLLSGALDGQARERVQIVRLCARTLVELVSGALDLAKFEAGKLRLNRSRVRPGRLLQDVAMILSPLASEKGIEIRVDLNEGFPTEVETDPIRLRQVLFNFVGNAIKYSNGSFVVIRGSTEAGEGPNDVRLILEVADTGEGMTQEQAASLFEEYRQLGSGSDETVGTGLGLSISKDLANLLGGDIHIRTAPGEGTTFVLSVPVVVTDSQIESPVPVSPFSLMPAPVVPELGRSAELRVLLIDDDVISVKVTSAMLEGLGHRVTSARDATRGREMALAGEWDALLVDVELDGVDGIELGRELVEDLAARGAHPRFYAYSGHVEDFYRERARAAGYHGFITKPCSLEELEEILTPGASTPC